MKQNVSPVIIVIAVVVLVALIALYGRKTLAPRQPDVSPDNAPGYAKEMMKTGKGNPYIQNIAPK